MGRCVRGASIGHAVSVLGCVGAAVMGGCPADGFTVHQADGHARAPGGPVRPRPAVRPVRLLQQPPDLGLVPPGVGRPGCPRRGLVGRVSRRDFGEERNIRINDARILPHAGLHRAFDERAVHFHELRQRLLRPDDLMIAFRLAILCIGAVDLKCRPPSVWARRVPLMRNGTAFGSRPQCAETTSPPSSGGWLWIARAVRGPRPGVRRLDAVLNSP